MSVIALLQLHMQAGMKKKAVAALQTKKKNASGSGTCPPIFFWMAGLFVRLFLLFFLTAKCNVKCKYYAKLMFNVWHVQDSKLVFFLLKV